MLPDEPNPKEDQRSVDEELQQSGESERVAAEHGREAAERQRRHGDSRRDSAEFDRAAAELLRAAAEEARAAAESLRAAADAARDAAIEQRQILDEIRAPWPRSRNRETSHIVGRVTSIIACSAGSRPAKKSAELSGAGICGAIHTRLSSQSEFMCMRFDMPI